MASPIVVRCEAEVRVEGKEMGKWKKGNSTVNATYMLVNSYVVSRLDYSNGIFASIPKINTDRLNQF